MGEERLERKEEVPAVAGEVIEGATAPAEPRRLLRSRQQRLIAGVCGGLAEYLGADPVLVRALWVVLTLITGLVPGVALYILAMFLVPEGAAGEVRADAARPRLDNRVLWGGLFILLGVYLFLRAISGHFLPAEWLAAWNQFWGVVRSLTLPAVLIGVGLLLMLGLTRRGDWGAQRLARVRQGRVIAGVCGGLGRYFRVDPTWVRVLWVLLFIFSWGTALLLYVLAMLLMPEE